MKRTLSRVLERSRTTVHKSKANSRYFPLVVNEMAKVGMADDLLEIGVKNTEGVYFRTPYGKSNEVLARMQWSKIPKEGLKYDFVAVNLGQDDLAAIMLKHARKYDTFEVKWSHRFAGVKQDETGVIVCAVTAQGEKFFKADWLIGCDGAGSAVRRALCIPFEGHTWTVFPPSLRGSSQDYRFMASNVKYDFRKHGYGVANMVVDQEDWAVIGQITPDVWRVAYGEPPNLSEPELRQRLPAKYERLLPGPRPLQYELISANPYWAHQRTAATYRDGKVILCGDAAHVHTHSPHISDRKSNNPIGGLGLTTGLLDAATLGNVMIRVINKGESDDLVTKYSEIRRKAWIEVTDKESTMFKHHLTSTQPDHVEARNGFFNAINNDPDLGKRMAESMNATLPELSLD
jgi:2-polyprenyl-6-methoxyphenol hydroxylase-like FAD-dependent oxidoreductase